MGVPNYTDAEHDAYVKAIDAGADPKKTRIKEGSRGQSGRRSARLLQPGWAQLLTNDIGRILSALHHLEDLCGQSVRLLRAQSRTASELDDPSESVLDGLESGKVSEDEYFELPLSDLEDSLGGYSDGKP